MCDCIREIAERVMREKGACLAYMTHNEVQKSEFYYKWITDKGEPSKHCRYVLIPWAYCPFCGVNLT